MCIRDRQALSEGNRVTDAIYDAGFSGPSRFYDNMEGRMGMTASAWVNGGKGVEIHWAVVPTSLGDMLVAATDKGVCRLSFAEGRGALENRFPAATLVEGGTEFAALLSQVVAAVEAPTHGFDHIPIDVKGTAFQEAVWRELRQIPAGETRSYAAIAADGTRVEYRDRKRAWWMLSVVYPLLPFFLTTVLGAGAVSLGVVEGAADAVSSLLKLWSGRAADRRGGLSF